MRHRRGEMAARTGRPGPLRPYRTVKGSSSSLLTSSLTSSHFFALQGAEVGRTVGALVLPHGHPEASVAHTALLLLALCDHRCLLSVRLASDCRSRCNLARKCPRRASPRAPRRASMVPPDARRALRRKSPTFLEICANSKPRSRHAPCRDSAGVCSGGGACAGAAGHTAARQLPFEGFYAEIGHL